MPPSFTTAEPQPPERPPACPQCNGRVVPLRDCYRCLRCAYSMCLECEGEREEVYLPVDQ